MRSRLFLITIALATLPTTVAAADLSARQMSVLSPSLVQTLTTANADTGFDVLVALKATSTANEEIGRAASARSLPERYALVEACLRREAERHQAGPAAAIASLVGGRATIVNRFWITNALHVRADRTALLALAERDDIALIAPNPTIELLQPVSVADASAAAVGAQSNLAVVGARSLWARGLTGRGRLVASIDTGVEGIHPALRDRWRGNRGDTAAAWFDPYDAPAPIDNNGHGTHVMGIMVGRDGADTIGLAPDAEWINAAVVDRGKSLSATFADILAALQWVADPDGNPATMEDVPDVVCNSWGVSQKIINPCDSIFFDAIDHVEAVGIVCVFAAGNEGPYSVSIRNPADRAVTPTSSFSVGAVDATSDVLPIPGFSSRGPSACDGVSIKPELVAPGVSIRSAYKGQSYKLISGTSMSAPHVAAAVALLRQYNPDLTPEEIKTVLLSTARDIDLSGEDNSSGHGILDLEAALAAVPPAVEPQVAVAAVAPDADGDQILAGGETGSLVVSLTATQAGTANVLARVQPLTAGVSLPVDTARFGVLPVGQIVDNASSPFVVAVPTSIGAGDSIWFALSLSGDSHLTSWTDTFAVLCGLPPGASVQRAGGAAAGLSLSNFGQLGLGPGSSLDAGGDGWRARLLPDNLLYEGALMIASGSGGFADASRRASGALPFDFCPLAPPADLIAGSAAGSGLWFDDSRAPLPAGVLVSQRAEYHLDSNTAEYATVTWTIRNRTALPIEGLQIGWLLDVDLPRVAGGVSERVSFDPSSHGVYHGSASSETVAGVIPINMTFAARRFHANAAAGKLLLSETEKRDDMQPGVSEMPLTAGDYCEVLATGPVNLAAGDSLTVAVAFIVAPSAGAFSQAAGNARDRWLNISGINDGQNGVRPPLDYVLGQNYPNPFNAQTIIPLTITVADGAPVRLEIIDILGRRVRTLVDGVLAAGRHDVSWDGAGESGRPLASGVYFSRLVVSGRPSEMRPLVLLK